MTVAKELETIIVISYFIVLALSIFIIVSIYNEYTELKKDENLSSGSWHVGTFFANHDIFLPIDDKTESQLIQKIISKHRKALIFFWIWFLTIIPIIII